MLVLLSGVSGAGKDTIKKELIARMDNVESLPSFTDILPLESLIPVPIETPPITVDEAVGKIYLLALVSIPSSLFLSVELINPLLVEVTVVYVVSDEGIPKLVISDLVTAVAEVTCPNALVVIL